MLFSHSDGKDRLRFVPNTQRVDDLSRSKQALTRHARHYIAPDSPPVSPNPPLTHMHVHILARARLESHKEVVQRVSIWPVSDNTSCEK